MSHLSDEQLSAKLDGALDAAAAARADAHLAECGDCRARFADLTALEASLPAALTHDPGEAYFANFADRVSARIAAESAPAAAAAARSTARVTEAPRGSWLDWLRTPRGLAFAGGALALLVVGAIGVQLARDHGPSEFAAKQSPAPALGNSGPAAGAESRALSVDQATPEAATPAPMNAVTPQTNDAAPQAKRADALAAEDEVAARPEGATPPPAQAPRSNVQELKTLENGEQVPVSSGPAREAERRMSEIAQKTESSLSIKARQTARPMGGAALAPQSMNAPPPSLAPQAPSAARLGGTQPARDEEGVSKSLAGAARLCGRVADAQGRAIAGASVALRESGVSVVTDADGGFCIDAPRADAPIVVNAVGFASATVRGSGTASAQALSVTLQPVEVLVGANGATGAIAGRALLKSAPAPGADAALTLAHDAELAAQRDRTAAAWSTCAERWNAAASLAAGAAADEARYHAAAARIEALALAPAAQQSAARSLARRDVAAYLAHAPAGAARDQALRWRAQLAR